MRRKVRQFKYRLCFGLAILTLCAFHPKPVLAQSAEGSVNSAALPDAPRPQNAAPAETSSISAAERLPVYLAPQVTQHRLTPGEKFALYVHQTTSPLALVGPALSAGMFMLSPKSKYPHDWKAGGDGFGRLFGDRVAQRDSEKTAQFLAAVAFHEDPRYSPSTSTGFTGRTYHALSFAVVDRSDSGRKMPAISNFAGAAAKGFVGMGYLPAGYNDAIHAGQRAAITFAGYALGNVLNEYCPEWSPLIMKLRIPFVHSPCAERVRARQHP